MSQWERPGRGAELRPADPHLGLWPPSSRMLRAIGMSTLEPVHPGARWGQTGMDLLGQLRGVWGLGSRLLPSLALSPLSPPSPIPASAALLCSAGPWLCPEGCCRWHGSVQCGQCRGGVPKLWELQLLHEAETRDGNSMGKAQGSATAPGRPELDLAPLAAPQHRCQTCSSLGCSRGAFAFSSHTASMCSGLRSWQPGEQRAWSGALLPTHPKEPSAATGASGCLSRALSSSQLPARQAALGAAASCLAKSCAMHRGEGWQAGPCREGRWWGVAGLWGSQVFVPPGEGCTWAPWAGRVSHQVARTAAACGATSSAEEPELLLQGCGGE